MGDVFREKVVDALRVMTLATKVDVGYTSDVASTKSHQPLTAPMYATRFSKWSLLVAISGLPPLRNIAPPKVISAPVAGGWQLTNYRSEHCKGRHTIAATRSRTQYTQTISDTTPRGHDTRDSVTVVAAHWVPLLEGLHHRCERHYTSDLEHGTQA